MPVPCHGYPLPDGPADPPDAAFPRLQGHHRPASQPGWPRSFKCGLRGNDVQPPARWPRRWPVASRIAQPRPLQARSGLDSRSLHLLPANPELLSAVPASCGAGRSTRSGQCGSRTWSTPALNAADRSDRSQIPIIGTAAFGRSRPTSRASACASGLRRRTASTLSQCAQASAASFTVSTSWFADANLAFIVKRDVTSPSITNSVPACRPCPEAFPIANSHDFVNKSFPAPEKTCPTSHRAVISPISCFCTFFRTRNGQQPVGS